MATSSSTARTRSIRHPQNAYNGAEMLSSSTGPSVTSNGPRMSAAARSGGGPSTLATPTVNNTRSSVAEFEDLLYQANYAANHYDSQQQQQPLALGPRPSQRSKTPEARKVRNSLHKPNPNNYMATGTPPRPGRTNTQYPNDYRNDDQRERRLSLPSTNNQMDRDYYQHPMPNDFSQSSGTMPSMPPARSRSGTQSAKNKKGMLSFMSGMYFSNRISPRRLMHVPQSLWYPEKARN